MRKLDFYERIEVLKIAVEAMDDLYSFRDDHTWTSDAYIKILTGMHKGMADIILGQQNKTGV